MENVNTVYLLVQTLKERGLTVSAAESCTGGLLGKLITDIPGSSAVYPGGVISYCNAVKHGLLGVDQDLLDTLGPVSEPVARQMAEKARALFGTDLGIGITGLAGPDSDGSGRPVGLVYVAAAGEGRTLCREFVFEGGRAAVREQAAEAAADLALNVIEK